MSALSRRDLLRIVAGVPLVIGAGRLARAFGGDRASPEGELREMIEAALAGRGPALLLIAVPHHDDRWHAETFARRQRLARHLAEILEHADERRRLLLAQLAIVVAPETDARAAARGPAGEGEGAPIWIAAPGAKRAERVAARLDGTDDEADALVPLLDERLLGGELRRLRARSDEELARADRAAVDRRIARLADGDFETREAASAWLAERRAGLLATLALHAFTAKDPETRMRCADLAAPEKRLEPAGTAWEAFHGGCAQREPYEEDVGRFFVKCGMAATTGPARDYLRLLGGR